MNGRTARGVAALLVLLGLPWTAWAEELVPDRSHTAIAVVIGGNRSDVLGVPALRFADDDAVRYQELFSLFATRVDLLAVLDDDTQRRHPEAAGISRVPTRGEVLAALDRAHRELAEAKARGETTAFYFVFAGHGFVGENAEGYLVLQDGRLTRSDLYRYVISASPADATHLVLDACHAYFMVARRGGKGRAAAISQLLDEESLDRYPQVGVLAATTKSAEVHEWARIEAGVFSHQVRSALSGAADVDGDGRIRYDEVGAFIAAANAQVTDPRGKLSVLAVPPRRNRNEAIVDWSAQGRSAFLDVEATSPERFHLDDDRGVRTVDLHPAGGPAFALALVPGRTYYARGSGWEAEVRAGDEGERASFSSLSRSDPEMSGRGSLSDAFERDLFSVPFGTGFYFGYVESSAFGWPTAPIAPPTSLRKHAAWSVGGTSFASVVAGSWFAWESRRASEEYRGAYGSKKGVESIRRRSDRNAALSAGLFGVGVAGATGSWLLLRTPAEHSSLEMNFTPDHVGARIHVTFGGPRTSTP